MWSSFKTVSFLLQNRLQGIIQPALCWDKGCSRSTGSLVSHWVSEENKFHTSGSYSLEKTLNTYTSKLFHSCASTLSLWPNWKTRQTYKSKALLSSCAIKSRLLLYSPLVFWSSNNYYYTFQSFLIYCILSYCKNISTGEQKTISMLPDSNFNFVELLPAGFEYHLSKARYNFPPTSFLANG